VHGPSSAAQSFHPRPRPRWSRRLVRSSRGSSSRGTPVGTRRPDSPDAPRSVHERSPCTDRRRRRRASTLAAASASASVVEATGPVLSRLVVAWHARRHASARLARRAPRGPRRRLVRVMARQPRPSPLPCTEARVEPSMSRTESASCAPSLVVTSLARTHDRRRRDRETWAVSENNSDRTKSSVVRA